MLTPTDYADLAVTAVEGGVNYWAAVDDYIYSFADLNSGEGPENDYVVARITDFDTQESRYIDSRTEQWYAAVEKAAEYFELNVEDFFEDHDASYADVAVQFALFGEVVYG